MPMQVELIQTTTRDGVRLDGMYQGPSPPSRLPIDAVCFLHGTGGNFYGSTLFDELGKVFLDHGCGVLRVNSRGHDGMSTAVTPKGGVRQGAAYEAVDDCRHDVAAWFGWLRNHVGDRVGLLGHSLGAVKILYALAQEPRPAPVCLLAVSPPRLSYSWFCNSTVSDEFRQTYGKAEELVEAGQPAALMDVRLPIPFVITAAGYREKYGPEERYNYLNFVGSVPCPTLVTLGSKEMEQNMAFTGGAEAVAAVIERKQDLALGVIPEADHFYTGVREELARAIMGWLHKLQ